MEKTQIMLLTKLAEKIMTEKKDKKSVLLTLRSAKILNKNGNFTTHFHNLNKIFSNK